LKGIGFSMYIKAFFKILCILIFNIYIIQCSENSSPVDDEGDHARGIGILITKSGSEAVRYEYEDPVTGQLSGKVGQISPAYEFMLIDDDGDAYTPDTEHHELRWEISDTTIAKLWQHEGEEGGYEFHVDGISAGITSIVFEVYHEGHADFVSKPVPIMIEN